MQYLPMIARLLLGIYFLIFGLNGFFHFLPQPPMPDEAGKAIGAIFTPSYQMTLVKAIETIYGIALLTNRFVALALILLAVYCSNFVVPPHLYRYRRFSNSNSFCYHFGVCNVSIQRSLRRYFEGLVRLSFNRITN